MPNASSNASKSSGKSKPKPKPGARRQARSRVPGERLRMYQEKRRFSRTPEPRGGAARARATAPVFVVQKHAARALHYDFRLELDGVLLSWSVPKGPSLSTGERRLAVRTEDHPIEYATFEGIIPKGEYGGGTVIVWDQGTWTPEGEPHEALEKGRLSFALEGEKLRGRFHLVRTRTGQGKHENWLLFKGRDPGAAHAPPDLVRERPESVLTGRTIEEVAADPSRVWHSNRESERQPSAPARRTARPKPAGDGKVAETDVVALVSRLKVGIDFTNLDKVLYPEQNLRKAELIAYYASVAERMLPYLRDRPLTLLRCPHGHHTKCFFQKHVSEGVPDMIRRIEIAEGSKRQESELYMSVRDMPGLLALAQLGVLEIHTWPCRADKLELPDQLIFDMDPADDLPWSAVVEAAQAMRALLEEVGLQSFVKTTGGKGLHVVAPLQRKLDWDTHKAVAFAVARALAEQRPDRYLTNMRKDLRKGRVFLDYLRNGRGATAVAPYSTRAREGATVATPVSWEELEAGIDPKAFTIYAVLERIQNADPWRDYAKVRQGISSSALRKLGAKT